MEIQDRIASLRAEAEALASKIRALKGDAEDDQTLYDFIESAEDACDNADMFLRYAADRIGVGA